MSTDLSGTNIGPYRVVSRLGSGGMADVYKAFQPQLDRYVAIKFIRPELALHEDFRTRFENEAKAIAKLSHGNIVHVYDFGEVDKRYYLVMEFIDGQSFKDYLQRLALQSKRPTLEETHQILSQVAAALDYAHQRGIVHRDVKPDNILITSDGRAVLNDFGIAKMLAEGSSMTQTGAAIGTPAYMSPEQIEGDKTLIGPPSDIYSLGIILFEIVTGKPPFTADTPMAVMMKHLRDPIPIPRQLNPNVPEPLERVIFKALAKSPADRYQTAGDLAKALEVAIHDKTAPRMDSETLLDGTALPQPTPAAGMIHGPSTNLAPTPTGATLPPTPPARGKMGMVIAAIVVVLVLILGGGGYLLMSNGDNDDEKAQATERPTDTPLKFAEAATETRTAEDQATSAAANVTAVALAPPLDTPTALPTASDTPQPTPTALVQASEEPVGAPMPTSSGIGSGGENVGGTNNAEPTSQPEGVVSVQQPTEAPSDSEAPTIVADVGPATADGEGMITPSLAYIENLSNTSGKSDYAQMAFDGAGNLHVVWGDTTNSTGGEFFARTRTPDGIWSEAVNLSEDKDVQGLSLSMATKPDGTVCVFWSEVTTHFVTQTRCYVAGTWTPIEDVMITRGGREQVYVYDSSGTLHHLYMDGSTAVTFDDTLLSGEVRGYSPAIATQGDTVAVVWQDLDGDRLQLRTSPDAGATWSAVEDIVGDQRGNPIALAFDSQTRLHIVWVYSGSPYYMRQTAEGWSEPVKLNVGSTNSGSTTISMVLDADDRPHVVWQGRDLVYAYQNEAGEWQPALTLAEVSNSGYGPMLAIGPDGTIEVLWPNDGDTDDIFHGQLQSTSTEAETPPVRIPPTLTVGTPSAEAATDTDTVPSLAETLNLSNTVGSSDEAVMALDKDGNVHVVWWDNIDSTEGDFYHRMRTPDGTWTDAENLSADQAIFELTLQLATKQDGTVCVFWHEVTTIFMNQMRCFEDGAWTPVQDLFEATGSAREYHYAFDSAGNVHALHIRSAGEVWVDDTQLTSEGELGYQPAFAAKGDKLIAVWLDVNTYRIQMRVSRDAGVTWGEIETVVPEDGNNPLAIVIDSNDNYHMVYLNGGRPQYLFHSPDGWTDPVDVGGEASGSGSTTIGLALDANDTPHIVWQGYEVNYTYRHADGTWEPATLLVAVGNSGTGPAIVITPDGTRVVMWPDDADKKDIFAGIISEEAETEAEAIATETAMEAENETTQTDAPTIVVTSPQLSDLINLSDSIGNSDYAGMALDGAGNVHVIWWDNSESSEGDVYHRMKTTDGAWTEVENISQSANVFNLGVTLVTQPDGTVCAMWTEVNTIWDNLMRCWVNGAWTDAETVNQKTTLFDYLFDEAGTLHTLSARSGTDIYVDETIVSDHFGGITPVFATHGTTLAAIWYDLETDRIRARISPDLGTTWGEIETVVPDDGRSPLALAIDSQGNLHFFYQTTNAFNYTVRSADGWSDPINVRGAASYNIANRFGMTLDADDHPHLVWQGAEIIYTYQLNDGTWTLPATLTEAQSTTGPMMVIDANGTRHLMWRNDDDHKDIFYATITEGVTDGE